MSLFRVGIYEVVFVGRFFDFFISYRGCVSIVGVFILFSIYLNFGWFRSRYMRFFF